MHAAVLVGSMIGAAGVIAWRMREARSPVSLPKIVIPPMGMSTGFLMFLYPPTRVPWSWAAAAVALGALVLAWPMVSTSRLTVMDGRVHVERSKAFLWVLLGLLAVRFALRGYVEHFISPMQTGALFFLLAFGMVARWRLDMLWQFKKLHATLSPADR